MHCKFCIILNPMFLVNHKMKTLLMTLKFCQANISTGNVLTVLSFPMPIQFFSFSTIFSHNKLSYILFSKRDIYKVNATELMRLIHSRFFYIFSYEDGLEYLTEHYHVSDLIDFDLHKIDSHAVLKHLTLSPIYQTHARFFLRDVMRMADLTALYRARYEESQVYYFYSFSVRPVKFTHMFLPQNNICPISDYSFYFFFNHGAGAFCAN